MGNQTMGLTPDQLQESKKLDKQLRKLISIREELKDFKLDDIYVMEEWYMRDPKTTWIAKGHMGFPLKFKVVYISPEGIPYIRKLNPNGRPTSDVYFPPQINELKEFLDRNNPQAQQRQQPGFGFFNFNAKSSEYRFIPDPEQLDSILLQSDFNPTGDHKEKLLLFNEINKHNKSITIKTSYPNGYTNISKFFQSKKPGDKFWMGGPDNVFVVQSISKIGKQWVIEALDKNQQIQRFAYSFFQHKRLYKDQPRSFKRESKT